MARTLGFIISAFALIALWGSCAVARAPAVQANSDNNEANIGRARGPAIRRSPLREVAEAARNRNPADRAKAPAGKSAKEPSAAPQPADDQKKIPEISPDARYDYQGEATAILQHLFPFRSLYNGPSSLRSRSETEITHTYTFYAGARLIKPLEVYINPELALGNAINRSQGFSSISNNDQIGQSSLRAEPYLARYFVRYRIPLSSTSEPAVQVGRAANLIAGSVPIRRIVLTAGKFAVTDIFDVSLYANNPRQQFFSSAFANNLAFDFPQETRGYTLGLAAAWVNPSFAVRAGTFAVPTTPGGPDLSYTPGSRSAEIIEGEIHPRLIAAGRPRAIIRVMGWRLGANLGRYSDALAQQAAGQNPDLASVRSQRSRLGVGVSLEQQIGTDSSDGVFARAGVADGDVETCCYAESDSVISLGGQMSGALWKRKDDRVGAAFYASGIGSSHRRYLAAGGVGFSVGDGALRYGPERGFETYYSYKLSRSASITADLLVVGNPGFNRDRGPTVVPGIRAYYSF